MQHKASYLQRKEKQQYQVSFLLFSFSSSFPEINSFNSNLQYKVKPAKAKLKWSSNKKKIATVTSKGVVKGKKAGTAKITVKSGKKSAKFKVKVKKAPVKVAVSNVEVLTSKTVRVTLNKAQKVAASKFSIYRKADSNGTAQKKLSIAKVNNTANKTYELVLSEVLDDNDNDKNCINDGDFVQVTVAGLQERRQRQLSMYIVLHQETIM